MRGCASTPPRSRSTSGTAGFCTTCCDSSPARAAPSLPARLAVFDLDGTISRRGTLAPYVIRLLARRPWRWLRVVMVAPALLAYLLGRIDRGALKARLLEKTLRGYGRAALEAW